MEGKAKDVMARWVPTSLVLVNWFTFDAETMPIDGPTVVIGENGAGKSSILDAISLLMNGVAAGATRFNAIVQGSAAARRSARDYILGTLDDIRPDQVPDPSRIDRRGIYRIRDEAIAYLALTVQHSLTERCGTFGACLTASEGTEDLRFVRRFIVEDYTLTHKDFTQEERRGIKSVEWRAFLDDMSARNIKVRSDSSGPEEFARQVFGVFGPTRGVRQEIFRRNLQNALAFREQQEKDISAFVRARILPTPEIDINALQAQIRTYREINARVRQVESLIAEGDAILSIATEAYSRAATAIRSRIALAEDVIIRADRAVETAQVDVAVFERALPDARERAAEARKAEEGARLTLTEAESAVAGSAAEQRRIAEEARRQSSKSRLELAKGRMGDLGRQAMPAVEFCRTILPVLPEATRLEKDIATALQEAGEEERLTVLLEDSTAQAIRNAFERLNERALLVASELQRARVALVDAQTNSQRAASGRAALGRETLLTLEVLRDAGIEASPLCDLVDEVQAEWAEAVEAVLGGAREAIIVKAERYRQAAKLVRDRQLFRSQLANTSKTEDTRAAESGSLALAVNTKNREARAFLDYRLGRVKKVDDPDDLRLQENAVTRDRWRMAGRIQSQLPMPRDMLLGRGARARSEELAKQELSRARQASDEAEAEQGRVGRLRDAALAALQALRQISEAGIQNIISEVSSAEGELLSAEARLMEAANSGDATLRRAQERARREVDAAVRVSREAILEEGRAEQALVNAKATLARLLADADEARVKEVGVLNTLSQGFPFVDEEIRKEIREVEWRAAGAPPFQSEARAVPIDREAEMKTFDYAEKRARQRVLNFLDEVRRFAATHEIPLPLSTTPTDLNQAGRPEKDFAILAPWLTERVAQDRNSVLVEYKSLAKEALEGAMDHLRTDYLGKIGGTVGEMERRIRLLNNFLAPRTFHGLRYRIAYEALSEWRDMIALARASMAEDAAELAKLEAGTSSPEQRAIAWLHRQIDEQGEEAFSGDLLDPRKWFLYDIAMHLKDGEARTSMSRRGATGSGGQVQAPLYVALICSVAAACIGSNDAGEPEGAISILLLDEAFGKLDQVALGEVVRFIEQCGLTPVMAVPDKERGTFRSVAQTMVTVRRHGIAGALAIQQTSRMMREAIMAARPAFPEIIQEQEGQTSPEAA